MRRTEHLVNLRASIIDLSPLTDVEGKRLVFQPQKMKGSAREVFGEVVEHPHVRRFLDAGWLRRGTATPTPPPPASKTAVEPEQLAPRAAEPDQTEPLAEPRAIAVEIEPSTESAPAPTLDVATTAADPAPGESSAPPAAAAEAAAETKPVAEELPSPTAAPESRDKKRR
jgi:hypothetical protein